MLPGSAVGAGLAVTCGLNELPLWPGVIGETAFSVGEGAADELGATLAWLVISGSVLVAEPQPASAPPATARPPSNATPRVYLFDDIDIDIDIDFDIDMDISLS